MSETPAPMYYNNPPELLHQPVEGDTYHDQLDNITLYVGTVTANRVFYRWGVTPDLSDSWDWRHDFLQKYRWVEQIPPSNTGF